MDITHLQPSPLKAPSYLVLYWLGSGEYHLSAYSILNGAYRHMAKAIALTKHQINRVLELCASMQQPEIKRAAIALSHTAIRVSEIARLDIKTLMKPSGEWRKEIHLPAAICKGLKSRSAWLSPLTIQILQEVVDCRLKKRVGTGLNPSEYQGLNPDSKLLFNNRGRPYALTLKQRTLQSGEIVTYRACNNLQVMMTDIYKRCGYPGATSHSGRMSFATNAHINRGISIEVIARLLGHDSPETTVHYIEISEDLIGDAYEVAL